MTTQEMIEVLQAYERGEKIEQQSLYFYVWHEFDGVWKFTSFTYRVAKPTPKKVRLYAFIHKNNLSLYFAKFIDTTNSRNFYRAAQFDVEVEE